MRIKRVDPRIQEQRKIVVGALLGVSALALTQLINARSLGVPLLLATYSFAAAIPLLAFDLYATANEALGELTVRVWYRNLVRFTGSLAATIGVGAMFWHLGIGPGLTFLSSAAIVLLLWTRFYPQLRALQKGAVEQDDAELPE